MKHTLDIVDLLVQKDQKEIIHNISCSFTSLEMTVIMGPNGSGKSTFAHAIFGDERFIIKGKILLDGKDISSMPTEKRSKLGLFLSFQSPIAISGVSVMELLRSSYSERQKKEPKKKPMHNPVFQKRMSAGAIDWSSFMKKVRQEAAFLSIKPELLERSIHEGFSGGEKKKIEILQALVLQPTLAIFDEIDTGLDVDALKLIGKGIMKLMKNKTGVIYITHNTKIMKYCRVNRVMVMNKGIIVDEGNRSIADYIEEHGYAKYQ